MNKQALTNRYDGMTFDQEKKNRRRMNQARFDGAFFDVSEVGLTKTVSITNADTAAKRVAVFPGNLVSTDEILAVIGAQVDYIAKEGALDEGTEKVTVIAEGLAYAQRHFCQNPTRVTEIQVSVDKTQQLSQAIEIYSVSPFRKSGSVKLIPKSYQRATDSNVNLVSVPTNGFQIDDQTCWIVTVAPGCSLDMTFFTGAVRNDAYLLKKAGESLAE